MTQKIYFFLFCFLISIFSISQVSAVAQQYLPLPSIIVVEPDDLYIFRPNNYFTGYHQQGIGVQFKNPDNQQSVFLSFNGVRSHSNSKFSVQVYSSGNIHFLSKNDAMNTKVFNIYVSSNPSTSELVRPLLYTIVEGEDDETPPIIPPNIIQPLYNLQLNFPPTPQPYDTFFSNYDCIRASYIDPLNSVSYYMDRCVGDGDFVHSSPSFNTTLSGGNVGVTHIFRPNVNTSFSIYMFITAYKENQISSGVTGAFYLNKPYSGSLEVINSYSIADRYAYAGYQDLAGYQYTCVQSHSEIGISTPSSEVRVPMVICSKNFTSYVDYGQGNVFDLGTQVVIGAENVDNYKIWIEQGDFYGTSEILPETCLNTGITANFTTTSGSFSYSDDVYININSTNNVAEIQDTTSGAFIEFGLNDGFFEEDEGNLFMLPYDTIAFCDYQYIIYVNATNLVSRDLVQFKFSSYDDFRNIFSQTIPIESNFWGRNDFTFFFSPNEQNSYIVSEYFDLYTKLGVCFDAVNCANITIGSGDSFSGGDVDKEYNWTFYEDGLGNVLLDLSVGDTLFDYELIEFKATNQDGTISLATFFAVNTTEVVFTEDEQENTDLINSPSFIGAITGAFNSLFPASDTLSKKNRYGFVLVCLLIVNLLLGFLMFKSGNAKFLGIVLLILNSILIFYFISIGYIPVALVIVIFLILITMTWFKLKGGG